MTVKYKSQSKEYIQQKLKNSRYKMLEYLGGECVECGFSDFRALQIDHIKSDGRNDRKTGSGITYHKKVMKSYKADEEKYQILCANCNWIKRHEKDENRSGSFGGY